MKRGHPTPPHLVGDPVDVITGEVTHRSLDFTIEGARGLRWERVYRSFRADQDRGLGLGHRHGLDWRLHFDLDGLVLDGPDVRVEFTSLTHDGAQAHRNGWTLERIDQGHFRVGRPGEPIRIFVRPSAQTLDAHLERLHHPDGGTTHLHYQFILERERLVGVQDTEGWALRLEWDSGHVVAVHESGSSRPTTGIRYSYDPSGTLVRGDDAYGHHFTWSYDNQHRVLWRVDRRGYGFVYEYDARGRCVRAAGEDGVDAVSLTYLPDLYQTKVAYDADAPPWVYHYDPHDRLLEIEQPDGGKRSFIYDAHGQQTGEVDPQGELWPLVRNEDGQVTGKRDPLGYIRDLHENPLDPTVDPLLDAYAASAMTQAWGTLIEPTFELPQELVFSAVVPAELRPTLWTRAEAGVERQVHDRQGRLLGEERRWGDRRTQTRRYVYGPNGHLVGARDYQGGEWNLDYASCNQWVGYRDPLDAEVRLEYSPRNKLVRFTDPGGTVTEYQWDRSDRLVGVCRNGAPRDHYVYDRSGCFVEHRDSTHQVLITYERGPLNTLLARTTGDGIEERFDRDERGCILHATTQSPGVEATTVSFEYDEPKRCLCDERPHGGVRHTYQDGRLHTTEVRVADQVFPIRYTWPDRDTLQVEDPTGGVHRVVRVAPGIVRVDYANNTTEISQYDPRGLCLAKASTGATGPWRRRFNHNAEQELVQRKDDRRGCTRYEYDAAHRIVATRSDTGATETFAYDLAGNLLSQPGLSEGQLAEQSGALASLQLGPHVALSRENQLLRANGDHFEYDARGHLSRREGPWGRLTYHWDALDRLRRIEGTKASESTPQLRWNAEYDALGRRTLKRVHGPDGVEQWDFFWDANRLAAERLPGGRIRVYVYPDPDALVPMLMVDTDDPTTGAPSGSVYVLQTDHRGAIERVEDSTGHVVWEAVITPFGEASILHGHEFHQPLRLVGQYYDEHTGLSAQRFRYWSPELGRFLHSDPEGLSAGPNLYAWPGCPLLSSAPLGAGSPGGPLRGGFSLVQGPRVDRRSFRATGAERENVFGAADLRPQHQLR